MKKMLITLLCCMILTACGTGTPEPAIPNQPDKVVIIYSGNDNADGFCTTEVPVEEVNMNVLVEELIKVGVLTEDIGIGAMKIDGTCLHLTFPPSFADLLRSQGTAGEYILMGSIVNTFLDAFEAETILIDTGNGILESGHVIYDFPMTRFE